MPESSAGGWWTAVLEEGRVMIDQLGNGNELLCQLPIQVLLQSIN